MSQDASESRKVSSWTLKNARLPPEAYQCLDHVQPSNDPQAQLPLVDLHYLHFAPPASTPQSSIVELHVSPASVSSNNDVEAPFDREHPFASICHDNSPDPHSAAGGRSQLVARFTSTSPSPSTDACVDVHGSLAIPGGLCHPHVHLDKPYLLDRCPLSSGTFDEALTSTASAKARFTRSDVDARMRRLITSSVSHGVTSMRAFVDVDPTVGLMCLDVACELKAEYAACVEVQIVAFAQDSIFYPDDSAKQDEMQRLLREAASRQDVDVVGSAPYVESLSAHDQDSLTERDSKRKQKAQQRRNIEFVFDLAEEFGKHVDFHLDYDLLPPGPPEDGDESMIPHVLSVASARMWHHRNGRARSVTMGHCTKLSSFSSANIDQLESLSREQESDAPPVSFVALPPSDLYMQGRAHAYSSRPRATLPLLELAARLPRFNWALGINNVANLFTPQGDADPLALLPAMVGVWQSAKPDDCNLMLAAISSRAHLAAAIESSYQPPHPDRTAGAEDKAPDGKGRNIWADLVVVDGSTSVQEAVCAPGYGRITVKDGQLVARRQVTSIVGVQAPQ